MAKLVLKQSIKAHGPLVDISMLSVLLDKSKAESLELSYHSLQIKDTYYVWVTVFNS